MIMARMSQAMRDFFASVNNAVESKYVYLYIVSVWERG
jgi:hypothetical protein